VTERLLTTRQVADFLGVSAETVLRRWRADELPGRQALSLIQASTYSARFKVFESSTAFTSAKATTAPWSSRSIRR
jgi:hypothetical protein